MTTPEPNWSPNYRRANGSSLPTQIAADTKRLTMTVQTIMWPFDLMMEKFGGESLIGCLIDEPPGGQRSHRTKKNV